METGPVPRGPAPGLHPFAHNGVARRRTLARLGEPSGDQHDQCIPQFFLRYVHAGLNLQEAIDTPAWHTEHSPRSSGRARHDPVFWSPKKPRPFGHRRGTAPTRHLAEIGPDWSEGRLVAAAAPYRLC